MSMLPIPAEVGMDTAHGEPVYRKRRRRRSHDHVDGGSRGRTRGIHSTLAGPESSILLLRWSTPVINVEGMRTMEPNQNIPRSTITQPVAFSIFTPIGSSWYKTPTARKHFV